MFSGLMSRWMSPCAGGAAAEAREGAAEVSGGGSGSGRRARSKMHAPPLRDPCGAGNAQASGSPDTLGKPQHRRRRPAPPKKKKTPPGRGPRLGVDVAQRAHEGLQHQRHRHRLAQHAALVAQEAIGVALAVGGCWRGTAAAGAGLSRRSCARCSLGGARASIPVAAAPSHPVKTAALAAPSPPSHIHTHTPKPQEETSPPPPAAPPGRTPGAHSSARYT